MTLYKNLCIALCISMLAVGLSAQKTSVYTDANSSFKRGMDFYYQGIYSQAQYEFQKAYALLEPVNEPDSKLLRDRAQLNAAKCAVRLNQPDGEKLVLDFARNNSPDPVASEAVLEIGNYYFYDGQYDKAAEFLANVNTSGFSRMQHAELQFKLGYSLFVRKRFKDALSAFAIIKDIQGPYYGPSNYYFGLCQFYNENYPGAIRSFDRVSGDERYGPYIPFYITQIHFAQGDYDKTISYGKEKATNRRYKKLPEMSQLVGQAYFEKGDFASAEPYLEYYAENGKNQRPEDYYQLAFVQYKSGKYDLAAKNFEQLGRSKSKMGQSAMYLLGDCQLKLSDKQAARNAFKVASKLDFDTEIQKEALYNYAKLSYDLGFDREAIAALQAIPQDSPYHQDAQSILSNLFLNTRDYAKAIEILEKMPGKTNQLKETYQRVVFNRAVQLMQMGNRAEAKKLFKTSLENPLDSRTKALTYYWLSDIAHQENNYELSINHMNSFLALAKTINRLPDEASVFSGNYLQGYNYIKKNDYNSALTYFKASIAYIKSNIAFIDNEEISQAIMGDASLRAGDCLFKRNKYADAEKFYDIAINNKYKGFVYANYQKAIIKGLRNDNTAKIIEMEKIVDNYGKSIYADDALLALGTTYQQMDQLELANNSLRRLVTDYRNSELFNEALLKLGLIAYNKGDRSTAINYYKQVFSNNPNGKESQTALKNLEEIYVDDLGQPEEYFKFVETIPGFDVKDSEKEAFSFQAAEGKYQNAEYEKAIKAFNEYLKRYGNGQNSLVAYFHLAESHSVLKQYNEALTAYEQVLARGNSRYYAKSLRNSALISYNHSQNFNKAFDFYSRLETVATDDTDRFEAQLGALQAAYRIDNKSAVKALAEKVAANVNANDDQKATANFYLAKMAFDNKDYNRAKSSFNEVIKLTNNKYAAESRYSIAYIYYVQRDLELAQQLCLNANKESSNYPYWVAKSVLLLADVLAEKGDFFNAQAALESLIENYSEDLEILEEAQRKLNAIKNKLNATPSARIIEPDEIDEASLEMEEGNGGK